MSVVGRQMSRSHSTAHHHRQYSDNFIDASKWLQSSSQDFGYGSKMNRSLQSNPSTPPVCSRSSSLRNVGDGHVSPGLFDLHSFDTELLPRVQDGSGYEGYSFDQRRSSRGRSFDESEPNLLAGKVGSRSTKRLPESSLLKSFSGSVDKERANNVAKIKVVVRKRPLNRKEMGKKEGDIITTEPNSNAITVHETKMKVDLTEYMEKHEFVFDSVLDEGVSNDEVYAETVQPVVPLIFQRTKATCFAYGQTGSGKTYTMQPLPIKASQDILRLMIHTYRNQGFQLFVSFFEIYGGKLFDLINDRKKLCMREDGKQQVCIVGLQEYKVFDVETIRELIERGNATRSTGTTGANEESSRSHAILQLVIKRSADGSESKPARMVGKLSFIDLAGSERGADTTDNDKQTRMEGAEINKSLLALKECIRALDSDQGHIPFRGSKLTEVLRDSFVGNSRTVMISCISPGSGSCEHTLNTLRYADRVKSLSKGTGSKRDLLSSSTLNLRDSTALLQTTSDDSITDFPSDKNMFVWSMSVDRDSSPPHYNLDGVPSGRSQSYQVSAPDDRWRNDAPTKRPEIPTPQPNNFYPDEDLNDLLMEEEDLISAHRQQVEETIDVVKEEMDLLVAADEPEPGNQIHDYVAKLNTILSQKAAGILQLQTRLAQFQRHLSEYNVIVSSSSGN
ncbi:unnamed protein product [Linum tenue]|uniref:Kinesin-like protein n=1 Tax=Linum tenue TaxID=586396 RepID=A0AAV0HYP2_9ROSI|nr:unnamed protein product [Linum tenue]